MCDTCAPVGAGVSLVIIFGVAIVVVIYIAITIVFALFIHRHVFSCLLRSRNSIFQFSTHDMCLACKRLSGVRLHVINNLLKSCQIA